MFVTRKKELELIFWNEMPDNSHLWSTFYVQGGNRYVRDWYFRNLNVDTVSNPIITDQYYYAVEGACAPQVMKCFFLSIERRQVYRRMQSNRHFLLFLFDLPFFRKPLFELRM